MVTEMFGGDSIAVETKEFTERGNARSTARWRRALGELVERGLLEDRSGSREIFDVTDVGFRVADILERAGT
jgi:predicted transcriptional regulator